MGLLKWLLGGGVPILLLILGFLFFANGLQDVSLDRFDLRGIKDISADSFTLDGTFHIKNPSELSVPVQSITYDVVLQETDERIGSGTLPSFTLANNKITKTPFSQEVRWVPTAQLVANLLTKEEVIVVVSGIIHLNLPKIEEYGIPFSQETDIKAYVQQFVSGSPTPIDDLPAEQPEDPSLIDDALALV